MKTRHADQLLGREAEGFGLLPMASSTNQRGENPRTPVTESIEAQGQSGDMTATASLSDADLLQRYEMGNSEAAFSALVERYQAMVLGTAFRKTGNLELAREVAQEVFAALARKARQLDTRTSLGGWLHQATTYQAARSLQSEARRHARHERFAEWAPRFSMPGAVSGGGSDRLAIIDEALGLLSDADREVIVLHYFQDLSYPEMAKVLGVNEPAVRQRVSRALDRMGKRLREQGVTTNVVVLLLGAVAVQSTVAAPVGLASAALATAAAGGGYSTYLLLASILSPGVIKTAAVILAAAGVATLWNEVPALQRAIHQSVSGPQMDIADSLSPFDPAATPGGLAATDTSSFGSRRKTSIAPMQSQVLGVTSGPSAAHNGPLPIPAFSTPKTAVPTVSNPPSVTTPAPVANSTPGPVAKEPTQTQQQSRLKDPGSSPTDPASVPEPLPSSPEFHFPGVLGEIAEVGGLPAVIDELRRVELIPREAAKLYGELLEDVLSLQPGERSLVEGLLEDHYERLNEQGIAGIRPAEIAEETWRTLRDIESKQVIDDVQKVLSAAAPDPEKLTDLLTLADKADSDTENPKPGDLLQTVGATVQPVTDAIRETVNGTVQPVSDDDLLPLSDVIGSAKLPLLK